MDFTIFKESKGFIKLLEKLMAIISFSTVCGFSQTLNFDVYCDTRNVSLSLPISYPFNIRSYEGIKTPICSSIQKPFHFKGNFSSESQFFVFMGVFSLIYAILCCIIYIFYHNQMLNSAKLILTDFTITCIIAFFWLIGSCVWAGSVVRLKYLTSEKKLFSQLNECSKQNSCTLTTFIIYGVLDVSILAGFTNILLWGSNIWFLRRDTPCLKDRYKEETDSILHDV